MATRKTTLIATAGSLVLGATLATPAFGAPPTYSGTLFCDRALDGQYDPVAILDGGTRKDIADWRAYSRESGFCVNGSFDASQLTRD